MSVAQLEFTITGQATTCRLGIMLIRCPVVSVGVHLNVGVQSDPLGPSGQRKKICITYKLCQDFDSSDQIT